MGMVAGALAAFVARPGESQKVLAALKPTGIVATSEFVPNADRVTPADASGLQPSNAGWYARR